MYEVPVDGMGWVGQIRTQAPQLWLMQDEQDAGLIVPQVDLIWRVHLPSGYRVSHVEGTVFTSKLPPVASPWPTLAQAGATVGGGVFGLPHMMLAASQQSREVASFATARAEAESAYRRLSTDLANRSRGEAPATAD